MSKCTGTRAQAFLFTVALAPILCCVFMGCSGDLNEPRYHEPVDTVSSYTNQTAYPGRYFAVVWNKDSIADSLVSLSLYRNNSFVEWIVGATDNRGDYSWKFPDTFDMTGRYRVLIMSKSNSSDFVYSPYISPVSYKQIDDYEPDNLTEEASPLQPDGSTQMHAISSADVDCFYFEAAAHVTYAIRIFGQDQTILNASPGKGTTSIGGERNYGYGYQWLTWQSDTDEACRFNVSGSSSDELGSYQVSVMPYTPIGAIRILHPAAGEVLTPGASDTIIWDASDRLSYVSIALMDSLKTVQTLSGTYRNTGKAVWTVPRGLDSSRNYRIKIYDQGMSEQAYLSGGFMISLKPDNAEPDNSPSQAFTLRADSTRVDRTITPGDSDWFAFEAISGQTYRISTLGATDMRLTLYDRDSAHVIMKNDDGFSSDKNAQIIMTCAANGNYYILAQGFSNTTAGLYGVRLEKGKAPSLSVDTLAPSCTTGNTVSISWKTKGLTGDLFRIELVKDSLVKLLKPRVGPYPQFSWLIGQDIVSGDSFRIKVTCVSDTSVAALSRAFRIVSIADPFEPDNSMKDADTSIVFGSVQHRTLPRNDSDWVAFHGSAGHTYTIGINEISAVNLSLTDVEGNWINQTSKSGPEYPDPKITWTCAVTGVYYILVMPYYNSATRNYGLVIFEE
jgi:hypothetical protein